MKDKKVILSAIISLVIGGIIGYLLTIKTAARFHAVNATCTTLNVAVDNNMLTPEQILELGILTKNKLGDSTAANYFKVSQQQADNAAAGSNCSQFMVGMSQ